ncbi:MAG TPA: metalloregulator ArsR/SmtB family transcription factor [Spirochaetia bacterium]|nr:metalloregulator ArsR/SmtB family transcription factor [Spirochaetia bacterium]
MSQSFEVLAEPNRRAILDLLRVRERPVGEIVSALGLSQPSVSKHLRILRDAGMVDARIDAQRRMYRLRAGGLRSLDKWLTPYRKMWQESLDSLEKHLDEMR